MLNDFRDVRLVPTTHFASNSFGQIDEAAIHPVLPEHTDRGSTDRDTERCTIRLDHAEGAVDGPKNEEYDEHVMGVPEAFVVGSTALLD
jgi:hypothetical protein